MFLKFDETVFCIGYVVQVFGQGVQSAEGRRQDMGAL